MQFFGIIYGRELDNANTGSEKEVNSFINKNLESILIGDWKFVDIFVVLLDDDESPIRIDDSHVQITDVESGTN